MTETHVFSALKAKRAEISGIIHDLEKTLNIWRVRLSHLDEAIRLFAPEANPEAIRPKKPIRRSGYFGRGEFSRLCMDAMRRAERPVTTVEIVAGAMAAKGLPDDPAIIVSLTDRVIRVLGRQRKAGAVIKSGTTRNARWQLLPDDAANSR